MQTYQEAKKELKEWIEFAPRVTQPSPANLQGFWKQVEEGDLYICSTCAGKVLARGTGLPHAIPVWVDEPRGVCITCE